MAVVFFTVINISYIFLHYLVESVLQILFGLDTSSGSLPSIFLRHFLSNMCIFEVGYGSAYTIVRKHLRELWQYLVKP